MIPPDLLARALDAYREHNPGPLDGFNAALSVLSAAWPEADGRRHSSDLTEDQWQVFHDELWKRGWLTPHDNFKDIQAALSAALSPPSAPAADVRIVRASVEAVEGDEGAEHLLDSLSASNGGAP